MLYDFYTAQNSKSPNTVHATYLLTGYREEKDEDADEDADGKDMQMEASPFNAAQQSDKTLVRCVVVVGEEKLTGTTATTGSAVHSPTY
jgi:phage protein D